MFAVYQEGSWLNPKVGKIGARQMKIDVRPINHTPLNPIQCLFLMLDLCSESLMGWLKQDQRKRAVFTPYQNNTNMLYLNGQRHFMHHFNPQNILISNM